MKTIGVLLKEARIKRRYSLKKVEEGTKIKKEFIEKIEKQNWEELPDFPVVAGFVKNLSSFLQIKENTALAILRRDYPPRPVSINPEPDLQSNFIWSPRLTFLTGVGVVFLLALGYLGIQYTKFISAPKIELNSPKEEQVVTEYELVVSGRTENDATIKVNNQPTIVDSEGYFKAAIDISKETKEIVVEAKSRAGKETIVKRKIKVEL